MRASLSLLSLFFLIACSGGTTKKSSIRVVVANPGVFADGGMIIFGTSGTNKFTRSVTSTSGSVILNIEIPKGTWNIGAVAWDGGGPFQGTVRCAYETSKTFENDTAALNLVINNGNCFNGSVSTESGTGGTPNTSLVTYPQFCEDDITGLTNQNCIFDPTYDYAAGPDKKRGFIGSYKFAIPAGQIFDNVSSAFPAESLESACFPANDLTLTTAQLNLPAFKADIGIPLTVKAFLGTGCDETKGVITRKFNDSTQAKLVPDIGQKKAYVRVAVTDVCSAGASNLPVASGVGTSLFPWVICNVQQLKAVQLLTGQTSPLGDAERGGYFTLGANINLFELINIGPGSTPFDSSCTSGGDTWLPMGKKFVSGCAISQQSPISMNFDGNGFTLSHVRYDTDSSESYNGFISYTTGLISNLKMKGVSIRGGDYTGAVAGQAGSVYNITVTDVRIEGEDRTGGIAGKIDIGPSDRLFVERADIEGKSNTGGVVGDSVVSLQNLYFSGSVYASSGSSGIGGIVGTTTQNITNAVSTGILRTGGDYFGGIAGTGQMIYTSRSDMHIKDYSMSGSRYYGGLAGSLVFDAVESFFHGYIQSNCPSCIIGGLGGSIMSSQRSASAISFAQNGGEDGATAYAQSDLRQSTFHASLCSNYAPVSLCPWIDNSANGDIPRHSFESSNPCTLAGNNASLASQKISGRGALLNPFRICHETQFAESDIALASKYYHVEQNINLYDISAVPAYNFNGVLNGKGHILHSLVARSGEEDSSSGNALFANNFGTIKNLTLAGFYYFGNDCSGCKKGTVALTNNNVIDNVRVSDLLIDMNDEGAGFGAGGIVAVNNTGATISQSRVEGDFRTFRNTGGVAGVNMGTINVVISRPYIEIKDAPIGPATFFGGITAQNSNKILRSTFEGEIVDTDGLASRIGGIAGIHTAGQITNVHATSESLIRTGPSSTYVGGLIGLSSAGANTVNYGIYQGLLYKPSAESTINEIVGDAAPALSLTNTFSFVKTYDLYRTSASLSTTPNPPDCEVTIGGTSVDDNTTNHGAIYFSDRAYFGDVTWLGTNMYKIVIPNNDCSQFSAPADFYATTTGVPTVFDGPTLKNTYGFNLADMTNGDDLKTIYGVYGAYIRSMIDPSVSVPTPPAWIYEPDDGDELKLFNLHD